MHYTNAYAAHRPQFDFITQMKLNAFMAPVLVGATAYMVAVSLSSAKPGSTIMNAKQTIEPIPMEFVTSSTAYGYTAETDVTYAYISVFAQDIEYGEVVKAYTGKSELHTLEEDVQPTPIVNIPDKGVIPASDIWAATGVKTQCFTFMGWQCITDKTSAQYRWRNGIYPNWDKTYGAPEAFDENGFGVVDGRYVVATSNKEDGGLAYIGQCLDVVLTDGTVIPCIVGEVKSCKDANWTVFGHLSGKNGISIIEFCVDKETWYVEGHPNPGHSECKPEWGAKLDYIVLY